MDFGFGRQGLEASSPSSMHFWRLTPYQKLPKKKKHTHTLKSRKAARAHERLSAQTWIWVRHLHFQAWRQGRHHMGVLCFLADKTYTHTHACVRVSSSIEKGRHDVALASQATVAASGLTAVPDATGWKWKAIHAASNLSI